MTGFRRKGKKEDLTGKGNMAGEENTLGKENAVGIKTPAISGSMRRMVLTLTALFAVLMIVINAALAYFNIHRTENAARQSLNDQVHEIDGTLELVENAANGVVGQDSYYLQSFQQPLDELDLYLISRHYQEIMERSALLSEAKDALFIYSSSNDTFILTAPELDYGSWMSMRDSLKEICDASGKNTVGRWCFAEIADEYYLIYILKGSGVSYGGCVPLQEFTGTGGTWDRYFETKDTDGQTAGILLGRGREISLLENGKEKGNLLKSDSTLGAFSLGYRERDVRSGGFLLRNIILLIVFSAVLLIAISKYMDRYSRRLTGPLEILDERMREFRGDEAEIKLEEPFEFRELEEIRTTFNTMTDRIRALKLAAYEERIRRQRTEYDFLRLQIKPHFYLNCLNQIFILSRMGKTEAVSDLTVKMMEYFRYLLRQDQELVTLREELTHIDDYLYIQKVRYPAGFHYEKDLDPALADACITSLLLITFVENSLKYGYSAYGNLMIRIRGRKEGDMCIIEISDSGPGFPASVLKMLQNAEEDEIRKGDGRKCIGIRNAVQRLHYAFGDAASITFENGTGLSGSTVTVRIPYVMEGKTYEHK